MAYKLKYNNINLIYIHIPKTGGTTIGRELMNNNVYIEQKDINLNGHISYYDIVKRLNNVGDKIENYKVFTTIRNPWDLYVSWFYYLKTQELKSNSDFKNEQEILKNNDINYFIKWVNENRDVEFFKNKGLNTKKYMEYIDWVSDDVDVYKLENIDTVNFMETLKIPLVIKSQHNKTRHKHYTTLYDSTSIELIGQMHKNDIKKYGYEYK